MPSEQAAPVAPAAPAAKAQGEPVLRRAVRHPRAPLALLIGGSAVSAIVFAAIAAHVTGWALDETIVKQSALHYKHGLPGTLFHDLNARATSRLFSLILMPIFALWDGDTGLRIARAFAAVCFATTSIPVYLLARRYLRSAWFAAAAGVLAITGPWVLISTTIYTENLAYPLFAWTLLAMAWAIERADLRGDLLVVVAIGLCTVTRVQLYALLPAWLIVVWVVAYGRSEGARGFARRSWRMAPISHALLGLVVLVAFFRLATGHLHHDVQQLLGAYSELQDRGHFSQDTLLAVAHEVQALALPAFLAAVAALAWFAGTLRGPRRSPAWSFAVIALCITAVLWVVSAYVQGGFLGGATEERYFFYVFPLVWIGAFAALEDQALTGPRLLGASIPVILLFATLGQPRPFDPQSTFLAPSSAGVRSIIERLTASWHLIGVSTTDALALVSILLLLLGLWAWRRDRRLRVAAFVGISVLTQLGLTGYAIAGRTGHVPGVQSQTGGVIQLYGWVDRNSGGNDVTWLLNQASGPSVPDAVGWQYVTLLWNERITTWAQDPSVGVPDPVATIAAMSRRNVTHEPKLGLVDGLQHAGPFVSYIGSPFFQVAGTSIAKGPGNGLELVKPNEPVQFLWHAQGLELDGSVDPKRPAAFDAWMSPGVNDPRIRITLQLAGSVGGPTTTEFQFGNQKQTVQLKAGEQRTVVFTACTSGRHLGGSATGAQAATISSGQVQAARIVSVQVAPAVGGRC